jgi:DNA-binding SARP family transcriptional activator/tetratricopeptide (TPR) repeat protein
MSRFDVRLLGRPSVNLDGESAVLQPKALAIVAFLARQPGGLTFRDRLCAMLWPDESPDRARHNLRQALWYMKRGLGSDLVTSTRDEVALTAEAEIDARTFAAEAERGDESPDLAPLLQTLGLYQGQFLEGFEYVAGPEFEDWLLSERDYLHRLFFERVLAAARSDSPGNASLRVVTLVERLYRLEPLDEGVAQQLMELYERANQPLLALRVYGALTRALQREIGTDPGPRLKALADRLRKGVDEASAESDEASMAVHGGATEAPNLPSGMLAVVCAFVTAGKSGRNLDPAAAMGEFRYMAERLAPRFGAIDREPIGKGYLFLFSSAEIAVQFALKLVEDWSSQAGAQGGYELQIACHFGECAPITTGSGWLGRGVRTARLLAEQSSPGGITITETLTDLLPASKFSIDLVGSLTLPGDHVSQRTAYFVRGTLPVASPQAARGQGDRFLEALSYVGTGEENGPAEEAAYRELLEQHSEHPEGHNNLAVLLMSRGEAQAAATHYREALRARPDYPEAHYNYATLLESAASFAAAADHYRAALRIRPEYVDAQLRYANLLQSRGQMDEARRRYERVLQLRPNYAEAHNNYAILLEDVGERVEARNHYRTAIRCRPDYPQGHYNLAVHFETDGNLRDAVRHYRRALELNPGLPEASNNLGAILLSQGKLTEALEHLETALERRPNDPECNYNYAMALAAAGNQAGAEEHFRVAREFSGEDPVLSSLGVAEGET